ncbi:hypothetical protein QR680_004121 [Steinernema hermaphroditum]|uniref:Uncharacterized protein n=1 Tax=Steinernema hermaphroditum TaxID=289476 RepID=A0AA39HP46_9BILA|nr:hypothetical protein QR680_004121 [Steinernema hermaphroditum]
MGRRRKDDYCCCIHVKVGTVIISILTIFFGVCQFLRLVHKVLVRPDSLSNPPVIAFETILSWAEVFSACLAIMATSFNAAALLWPLFITVILRPVYSALKVVIFEDEMLQMVNNKLAPQHLMSLHQFRILMLILFTSIFVFVLAALYVLHKCYVYLKDNDCIVSNGFRRPRRNEYREMRAL